MTNKQVVAFVAGATGYTGRGVVSALLAQGATTIAHVRPNSSRLDHWRDQFGTQGASVDATPWEYEALRETLVKHQPKLVFALLGTTRKRAQQDAAAGQLSSYETVDYGLSAMLLRAAATLPEKPRFVYLSSAGLSDKEGRKGSYMHARWLMERDLRDGDVPYTIARPSFITGEGRDDSRPMERFGAVVANGALSGLGLLGAHTLRDRYRSTDNIELGAALVRLALDPSAENRVFHSESLRG